MIDMVPVMEQLRDAGVFDQVVIVHLGTNGPFDRETLDAFLAPLSDVPNVLMINIRANRSWTASNNAILEARDNPNDTSDSSTGPICRASAPELLRVGRHPSVVRRRDALRQPDRRLDRPLTRSRCVRTQRERMGMHRQAGRPRPECH